MEETKKYQYDYWRPAVAADNVVYRFEGKELQVLLVKRGNDPYKGKWALPGGFLNEDETLEEAALRELKEETGVVPRYTEELCSCSGVNRDPRGRVISVVYYSFVYGVVAQAGDDAAEVQWFNIYELPEMAFDHEEVMRTAIEKLRASIKLCPYFFYLLDKEFTLPELGRLWSAIYNCKIDRRNFQKHWVAMGLVTNILELTKLPKSPRAPKYYRFNEEAYLKFRKKCFFK